METRRRSAVGPPGASPDAPCRVTTSSAPHSGQNFAPAATGVEQAGQVRESCVPHSAQNFAPGVFSVEQAWQSMR